MKKNTALVLLILFVFISSCAKKPSAPQAGSAKADDMLSLLPRDARGMIVVDVHRIMATEFAQKALQEEKNFQTYQHFIQETGIDPKKDVFFFVAALGSQAVEEGMEEAVAVINLKYERDLLLSKIKAAGQELQETEYNGVRVYQGLKMEEGKSFSGAFLDDSNIIVGNDALVKEVIDVYRGKAESILKNSSLAPLFKSMNKSAMVYGAFLVPAQTMAEAASKNPMLSPFESISSVLLSFDYRDKVFRAEIQAQSPDAEKNKQMADALNGFKALGSAAAAKEPDLGKLLQGIEILSTPEHVKISASLPEALLQSLSQKMKAQKAQPAQKPEEN